MPTPRSKWWTAHSTIDEPGDPASKGRFRNLCDLHCERYWRDGLDPDDLRTQTLDTNAIRRVTGSQDRPSRCTRILVELAKCVSQWRDVGAVTVSFSGTRSDMRCTIEWPNAPEYLGLTDRLRGPLGGRPRTPQDQTRPDRTFSESEVHEDLEKFEPDPVLPPESQHTAKRWLESRGYRVSDAVVRALFKERMRLWSPAAPLPTSSGAAFVAWLKKQNREGELPKIVEACGGSSLKAELEEIMSDVADRDRNRGPHHSSDLDRGAQTSRDPRGGRDG